MGFGVRNVEELLDCLGTSKKEWALILLLDQEHQTHAGREIVRGDLNLLTQLDEDSGNLFDFYIPGYCVSPKSCNLDNWDDPYEIRKLYQGSHLNSVGAVELKRLGVLCFSRLDFRTFYKYLEKCSGEWQHSGDCELILVKRCARKSERPRFASRCRNHVHYGDSEFTELCCYNLDDIVRNGNTVNQFCRQLYIEMSQGGNLDWATVKSRVDRTYSSLILPVDGPRTDEQAEMFDVGSRFLRRAFPVRGYVFISYSTKDAFQAGELRESLENMGIKCWMAPRDIPTGTSYACMIAKAIGDCAMFFLLLSRNSMESVWVEKEVLLAVSKLKKEGSLYVAWCSNTHPVTFSNGFEYTLVNVQVDDLLFSEKSIDLQRVVDHYYKFNLPAVSSISPTGWVRTLREMPSLCDLETFLEVCPWRRLTGDDWVEILSVAPSLEYKIPFDVLSADDTAILLKAFPHFAGKCDWGRVAREFRWGLCNDLPELATYFPWDCKDCQPWLNLLRAVPKYADRCPWNEFLSDEYEDFWTQLLLSRPNLIKYYGNAKAVSAEGWRQIFRKHPELVTGGDAKYFWESHEWRRVARAFRWGMCKDLPELARHFPWDCKDCQPWLDLLRALPEYADRCPWNEFVSDRYEEFWLKLLLARPGLVKYYGKTSSLSAAGWRQILRAHPELANNFSDWSVFDGADWAYLLSRRPALAPYCDSNNGWQKFLPDDWIWLLRYRPCFEEKRTYNGVPR